MTPNERKHVKSIMMRMRAGCACPAHAGNYTTAKFMPYGDLHRMHYDVLGNVQHRMALNALKHTDHEPIHRIVMVEELWPKQYNFSDAAWAMRYDEPKDPKSYYWQLAEMTDEGRVTSAVDEYLVYLQRKSVSDNPRLYTDLHRGREHYVLNPYQRDTKGDRE